MSESYTDFARVYDIFMDETPYEEWAEFLVRLILRLGISKPGIQTGDALESERNLVLDLGCGTGSLTERMEQRGFDMIGVDNSEDMLRIALEKKEKAGSKTLYLLQDMRELELFSTVGTVISVCDSINYLLSEEDLLTTFKLVNNYLYPGGLFIFDFNTVYKYETVIGDTTIAESREACSFIWDNFYHEEEQINEYDLTLFVQEEGNQYRRFQETHYQRGYITSSIPLLFLKRYTADTRSSHAGLKLSSNIEQNISKYNQ